jgi:hypothetical protein
MLDVHRDVSARSSTEQVGIAAATFATANRARAASSPAGQLLRAAWVLAIAS